jgi:hypothetical protein
MYKPTLRLFRGTKIVIFPEFNNINASLLRLTLLNAMQTGYQLAFFTPGIKPAEAISRN